MEDASGEDVSEPPTWDADLAEEIIGATMLVGMTYLRPDGSLEYQEQFWGEVVAANPTDGFCVLVSGKGSAEHRWLPPDPRAIQRAPPGEYRVRSTGVVVTDPDYLSTWTTTYHEST